MPTLPETRAMGQRLRDAAREGFLAMPGGIGAPVPGEPEQVDTPGGAPAYVLVSDRREEGVVAVARVLLDGRVASVARLAGPAANCAAAVTGLETARIRALAHEIAGQHGGTLLGEPKLVHDGPVGREAWLLVVERPGGVRRWVFATAGGTYERGINEQPRGGVI